MRRFAATIRGGFEPEYKAVLDKAISLGYTLPSTTTQQKDNDLIKGLKSDGEWNNISEFFYMLSTDGSPEFSTINWVNPDVFQLTKIGTPTFTSNAGWKGGSGRALNTNYSPANSLQAAGQDNFSYGAWLLENTAASSNKVDMGSRNSAVDRLLYFFANFQAGSGRAYLNDIASSNQTSTGLHEVNTLHSITRNGITKIGYNNGSFAGSNDHTSSLPPIENIYLLALNSGGSVVAPSDRTMRFAFAGNGILNQSDLYNRILTRLS